MKTLNEYMSMSYKMEIIEDQDEGGFVISYPDLPGCITCGETIESAMQNAKDAKREWIRAALEEGIEIYEPDSLENYSGQFKLRIPRSLHRSLAEHSQREGISMNQYCVYLLSKNDVMYSKWYEWLRKEVELKKTKTAKGKARKHPLYRWARLIAAMTWEEVAQESAGNRYMERIQEEIYNLINNE